MHPGALLGSGDPEAKLEPSTKDLGLVPQLPWHPKVLEQAHQRLPFFGGRYEDATTPRGLWERSNLQLISVG